MDPWGTPVFILRSEDLISPIDNYIFEIGLTDNLLRGRGLDFVFRNNTILLREYHDLWYQMPLTNLQKWQMDFCVCPVDAVFFQLDPE